MALLKEYQGDHANVVVPLPDILHRRVLPTQTRWCIQSRTMDNVSSWFCGDAQQQLTQCRSQTHFPLELITQQDPEGYIRDQASSLKPKIATCNLKVRLPNLKKANNLQGTLTEQSKVPKKQGKDADQSSGSPVSLHQRHPTL